MKRAIALLLSSLLSLTACGDKTATSAPASSYAELAWEDLELPGKGLKEIMEKFQPQIDAIPEGDPKEKAVMDEMQTALNNAPVNPALNGKKVKIPGFITVLDGGDDKGMVKEFLLVPYFGACIHVPPPPVNQTIYVKPIEGKSVGMERLYEPVWVKGTLSVETTTTKLAQAGYQIKDGEIEAYTVENAMQPDANASKKQPQ